MAAAVADLNLHVAVMLTEMHLPAALAQVGAVRRRCRTSSTTSAPTDATTGGRCRARRSAVAARARRGLRRGRGRRRRPAGARRRPTASPRAADDVARACAGASARRRALAALGASRAGARRRRRRCAPQRADSVARAGQPTSAAPTLLRASVDPPTAPSPASTFFVDGRQVCALDRAAVRVRVGRRPRRRRRTRCARSSPSRAAAASSGRCAPRASASPTRSTSMSCRSR